MSGHSDHPQTRRVVLPSGKEIDVVYFQEHEVAQAGAPLHVCPDCDAEFVVPVDWQEAGQERWEITLECVNCRWSAHGDFGQEQVDALESALDAASAAIAGDLRRLTRANMEDEAERFIAALDGGHIWPMDF